MTIAVADLGELWYVDRSTTYNTGFTGAGSWSGTKFRAFAVEAAVEYDAVPDPYMQTRFFGAPSPLQTIKKGSLKFRMHLPGGSGSTSPGHVAILMGACTGGIQSPTLVSDICEASCTTTALKLTSHGQVAGQAVMVGTRGDGYAEGKAGVIQTIVGVNEYALSMALPGIPATGIAVRNGHTIYGSQDPPVERYIDFLGIGAYAGTGATDDPDILNMIGCSGTFTLGGLAPNETPFVEFTFLVGDWRHESYATTKALAHTTAVNGDAPAGNQYIGALCLQDTGTTTRNAISGTIDGVAFNNALVEIKSLNGANGHAGWLPSHTAGPTIGITTYWGDMPGLYNDFLNGVPKQILCQWGHQATQTIVVDAQRAFVVKLPARAEIEKNRALKLEFVCDSGQATALSTAALKLQDAPLRLHLL